MNDGRTILVVDDEPKIVQLIRAYLEKEGFQVAEAHDGAEALEAFHSSLPDLIVLDLMLPRVDGIEVTRILRKESEVPIIILTAKAEEIDRLIGLELGADDYIVKPFSPRELVARIRAVLRRAPKSSLVPRSSDSFAGMPIHIGDLRVDAERRAVTVADRNINLTAFQFDLLLILLRNPRRVFSRGELLELTTGESLETYERTVDAHIKNIRKALGDDSRKPHYIHTVHGVGYKFDDTKA